MSFHLVVRICTLSMPYDMHPFTIVLGSFIPIPLRRVGGVRARKNPAGSMICEYQHPSSLFFLLPGRKTSNQDPGHGYRRIPNFHPYKHKRMLVIHMI